MGVRLIVEVLDHWRDAGLTAGERDDLIVLAENANDRTRLTWGPVHAPYILNRANKSAAGWKNAVGKLLRKKALTQHTPGRIGQVAVYHLTCLCPEAPHDGYQGFCTRPERVTSQVEEGHPADDPAKEEGHLSDDPQGHPTGDPLGQEGHLTGAKRVTSQVTPTPLLPSFKTPSTTSSTSLVAVADEESSVIAADGTSGGGGGDHSFEETREQDERAASFVDGLDYYGKRPSKQQRHRLVQRALAAFAAGWSEYGLRRYLDISDDPNVRSAAALYLHRLDEDELPDAVVESDPASLPPACAACLAENPAAEYNLRFRQRTGPPHGSEACPDCHPARLAKSREQQETDDWTSRAMARAQKRSESGDWSGASTDERVIGWGVIAQRLSEREALKPSTADQRVAQGMALAAKFREDERRAIEPARDHQPYSNDAWHELSRQSENGLRPDGADRVPHCGDPSCDEYSRTRSYQQANGEPHITVCGQCHPSMQF